MQNVREYMLVLALCLVWLSTEVNEINTKTKTRKNKPKETIITQKKHIASDLSVSNTAL